MIFVIALVKLQGLYLIKGLLKDERKISLSLQGTAIHLS